MGAEGLKPASPARRHLSLFICLFQARYRNSVISACTVSKSRCSYCGCNYQMEAAAAAPAGQRQKRWRLQLVWSRDVLICGIWLQEIQPTAAILYILPFRA